jgi:hypothetical protein
MALGKRLINTGGVAACTTDSADIFGDSSGIALYNLDYDASDASGNYDGTPTNVDFGVGGKINYGARFNGGSSYISIPQGNLPVAASARTVSLWIKTTQTASAELFGYGVDGTNLYYALTINASSGKVGTAFYANDHNFTASVIDGNWHHIVSVYNGNILEMYVDGNSVGNATAGAVNTGSGGTPKIGKYNYTGDIDQVRIFSKALNSTEVGTLYAETACVYTATTDNNAYPVTNVAYYKLDNSSEDFAGTNDGTDSNIEYRFGRFGQAAVFNGSNSYISGLNGVIPSTSTDCTFSCWFKMDSGFSSNFKSILGGTGVDSLRITMNFSSTGNYKIQPGRGKGSAFYSSSNWSAIPISVQQWYHLVCVYTNSTNTMNVYIDNVLVDSEVLNTTTSTAINTNLVLGYYRSDVGYTYWDGDLDQVRIFNTALSTSNVTDLYNEKPEVDTSNFKAVLYDGTGATDYISNVGFEPDLIWFKERNGTNSHQLYDSVRGFDYAIYSDLTDAQYNYSTHPNGDLAPASVEANGFFTPTSANNGINRNGGEYVSWNWKAGGAAVANTQGSTTSDVSFNTAAGFSIVKYTGAGDVNVGHGLSAAPNLIISKITNVGGSWVVYNSISGTGKYLVLNDTASIATASEVFSAVTDTTFTHNWSGNSYSYIAYCWHSVAGYSKIGSYTGAATPNAQNIGFRPSFILLKGATVTENWSIYDSKRGTTQRLYPDLANAEHTYSSALINFTDNGFEFATTSSSHNGSGQTYIYMAFK